MPPARIPRLLPALLGLLLAACAARPPATAQPHSLPTEPPPPTSQPDTEPPPPASPLAGLIFSANDALWQVQPGGNPANLAACAQGSALSPDGAQMLYASPDYDIYLLDLATCAVQNLTDTPDEIELNPQWWPNLPGAVLIGLNPGFDAGAPALLQIGREGIQPIDLEATPNDLPAISPDGQTLAYAYARQPILFSIAAGRLPLDLAAYGIDPALIQRADSPAFSPDGRRLAWVVGTQQGDDFTTWRIQLLILDLEAHTALFLHPYIPLGRDGWPPAPVWSPDGRWLAFNRWHEDPAQSGLVVLAADGSEEHILSVPNPSGGWVYQLSPPLWSPDSIRLAFVLTPAEPAFWWLNIADWAPQPLSLPEDSLLIAWR